MRKSRHNSNYYETYSARRGENEVSFVIHYNDSSVCFIIVRNGIVNLYSSHFAKYKSKEATYILYVKYGQNFQEPSITAPTHFGDIDIHTIIQSLVIHSLNQGNTSIPTNKQ